MDSAWLNDFLTLASHRSFSRAANVRNVTQPAFSRRIRMLEEWVGVPLFDRAMQPVELTEAGAKFQNYVEVIVAQLEEGRHAAMLAGERELNSLSFAATNVLSLHFFPRWLAAIQPSDPTTTINLVSGNTTSCEQSMLQGESHFLMCHYRENMSFQKVTHDTHESIVLKKDQMIPVSRVDENGAAIHRLDRDNPKTPVLLYRPGGGLGRIFRTAMDVGELSERFDVVAESHMALLLAMALEGRGVAWVPQSIIEVGTERQFLADAGGAHWSIDADIRLFRNREPLGHAAETFWSTVLENAKIDT